MKNKILKLLGHKFENRFTWGEFNLGGRDFGLTYTPKQHINIAIPFLFRIWVYLSKYPEHDLEAASYGFYYYSDGLWLQLGNRIKLIPMPWDLQWRSTELLDFNRKVVFKETENGFKRWSEMNRIQEEHSASYPYQYILKNGEVQNRIATINLERRTWSGLWFRWIKKVSTTINISFDGEVGEESGSWKGGVTGCSYEILENETPEQCLRRMEKSTIFSRY